MSSAILATNIKPVLLWPVFVNQLLLVLLLEGVEANDVLMHVSDEALADFESDVSSLAFQVTGIAINLVLNQPSQQGTMQSAFQLFETIVVNFSLDECDPWMNEQAYLMWDIFCRDEKMNGFAVKRVKSILERRPNQISVLADKIRKF